MKKIVKWGLVGLCICCILFIGILVYARMQWRDTESAHDYPSEKGTDTMTRRNHVGFAFAGVFLLLVSLWPLIFFPKNVMKSFVGKNKASRVL